jgi:hypothetical protein
MKIIMSNGYTCTFNGEAKIGRLTLGDNAKIFVLSGFKMTYTQKSPNILSDITISREASNDFSAFSYLNNNTANKYELKYNNPLLNNCKLFQFMTNELKAEIKRMIEISVTLNQVFGQDDFTIIVNNDEELLRELIGNLLDDN